MSVQPTPQSHKIADVHLARKAIVYVRQSSERQVQQNTESQRLQYALADRARALGWTEVEVVDSDLGTSAGPGSVRAGFDRVIASVTLGEVGIIFSREASRLSRTDRDWCHLLEVCGLFDTLIGDGEQVYDLSLMDDQLVLGIKGTLSVVELKILKLRMQQGMEEKARRGELRRKLTPGYVYDLEGRVVKDPDLRVQETIHLVFRKFRETWSVRQTFKWFHDEGLLVPANGMARGRDGIVWKPPTLTWTNGILHNPVYAGAYVYGRRPTEMTVQDGRLHKRTGRLRTAQECRVLIRNHHEAYLDWDAFEENQKIMRSNCTKKACDPAVAAVRSGRALLAGLLRCGRCGRKLNVYYVRKNETAPRYQCKGEFDSGGDYCLGFSGRAVEQIFCAELMKIISPMGLEASVEAIDALMSSAQDRRDVLARQFQQVEYEARRAFEQYNEVDARNRLVAAELERRWNSKLEVVAGVKAELERLDAETRPMTEQERQRIMQLGQQFSQVWNDERCPVSLKKKIVHTVVEEVVVSPDESGRILRLVIHWSGGAHTQLEVHRPAPDAAQRTSLEALEIIRRLAVRYGDDVIAQVLNKHHLRTGKGNRWTAVSVHTARRRHAIEGQAHTVADPQILTMGEAARHYGVNCMTIRHLVRQGILKMHQLVRWAPWEIERAALEAEPVQTALRRLLHTGRLTQKGVCSEDQLSIFT